MSVLQILAGKLSAKTVRTLQQETPALKDEVAAYKELARVIDANTAMDCLRESIELLSAYGYMFERNVPRHITGLLYAQNIISTALIMHLSGGTAESAEMGAL